MREAFGFERREEMERSKGHLGFSSACEFFVWDDGVRYAPIQNVIDIDAGVRTGSHWYCHARPEALAHLAILLMP